MSLAAGFSPPFVIQLDSFLLEALQPKHNEADYRAWNSSKKEILEFLDPEDPWMEGVQSAEMNLEDLTKDFQEFKDGICFRYAILSEDRSSYLGCFYVRPTAARGYDCRMEYWFQSSAKHLEGEFHKAAIVWLKGAWGLKDIALPGRTLSWEKYHALEEDPL